MFGSAININYLRNNLDNGEYNQKIKENVNIVVPENELKPQHIWLGENVYNFTDGDFLLGNTSSSTGWIQLNLMEIRGHTLLWAKDQWTPYWLLKDESIITPDKAKELLSDYIQTVVGRYRGQILCWDVVNEAIDDQNNTNPLNIRDGFWFRKLGPDFVKYAFTFAQQADPNAKLYYNEYGIEKIGLKSIRTNCLVNWLRSEGVRIDGIGLQWHIYVPSNIIPNDEHYQSAQLFVDNKLDLMITELDVHIATNGAYPNDTNDLGRQSYVYSCLLQYALHFYPNCKAMLTWGFTDRYSWIPAAEQYRRGAALPLDWLYLPKRAYWSMQQIMSRLVNDNIYRLSPQSQPDKCLGISQNPNTTNQVQLYSDNCNNTFQRWNITWQYDGTYRFSSLINSNSVLTAYNSTQSIGQVQISNWSTDVNQEWAFSSLTNNTYRIVPRTAWWRVMTLYGESDNISIVDLNSTNLQNWILTKV